MRLYGMLRIKISTAAFYTCKHLCCFPCCPLSDGVEVHWKQELHRTSVIPLPKHVAVPACATLEPRVSVGPAHYLRSFCLHIHDDYAFQFRQSWLGLSVP